MSSKVLSEGNFPLVSFYEAQCLARDTCAPHTPVAMAPNSFSLATQLTLPNGLKVPQIHLGVYLMSSKEASKAVGWALQAGVS
jgi:hypothetical protein